LGYNKEKKRKQIWKIGITFTRYSQSQKIGITFTRYSQSQKIGITFTRYSQSQKIGPIFNYGVSAEGYSNLLTME
jgi:hypothetical protein